MAGQGSSRLPATGGGGGGGGGEGMERRRTRADVRVVLARGQELSLASFQRLLQKQSGNRATWEYPFAVAGVNITFMIMQMLDLQSMKSIAAKPRTFVKAVFVQMLSEDEWAFDLLYCVAFLVMDKQWVEKNASYMDFNEILKSTRAQLEKDLLLEDVLRIEDMPSYRLLC
ncbi:ELMO domain-containing protein C-like [Triticum aestivum]|uniref:ELMO domain-containing protein C-like n=1 Tax=Triticum aestivum TaxID=4565 RepID=UPI001D02D51E|nr:ELMO domain-containing protein C-like [Triticum aestivum]